MFRVHVIKITVVSVKKRKSMIILSLLAIIYSLKELELASFVFESHHNDLPILVFLKSDAQWPWHSNLKAKAAWRGLHNTQNKLKQRIIAVIFKV